MNLPFFNIIKEVIKTVKNKNQADPKVKTADPSIFEQLERKVDNSQPTDSGVFIDDLKRNLNHVQRENRDNPNVETADRSVFENMQKELEALKAKFAQQNNAPAASVSNATSNSYSTSNSNSNYTNPPTPVETKRTPAIDQVMAMTNSGGGSLSIRTRPDMGAPMLDSRVSDSSLVKVLGYSDNSIHLDGKKTRFVQVDINGQVGWLLENYLNFN